MYGIGLIAYTCYLAQNYLSIEDLLQLLLNTFPALNF